MLINTYIADMLDAVQDSHNPEFNMTIKICGTGENSKWMDLSPEQFELIKQILIKEV